MNLKEQAQVIAGDKYTITSARVDYHQDGFPGVLFLADYRIAAVNERDSTSVYINGYPADDVLAKLEEVVSG